MLTPNDIEKKEFNLSLRGYNATEVDDFLAEICESYEEVYAEKEKLKAQVENLSEAVVKYKAMEDSLGEAMSVADKSANEIKCDANHKADKIIENAKSTADSMLASAEQIISAESYRFETMKREIEMYKAKIIELLNSQLSVLKEYPTSEVFTAEKLKENVNKEQMWQRKSTVDDKAPDLSKDDTILYRKDKTTDGGSFGDTADLGMTVKYEKHSDDETKESATEDLPCVKMDKDGNYIMTD